MEKTIIFEPVEQKACDKDYGFPFMYDNLEYIDDNNVMFNLVTKHQKTYKKTIEENGESHVEKYTKTIFKTSNTKIILPKELFNYYIYDVPHGFIEIYRYGQYGTPVLSPEAREYHEPTYYRVARLSNSVDLVPVNKKLCDNKKENQYNSFVGIYLDGNILNNSKDNVVCIKLTDEQMNHIKSIEVKYKKLKTHGSFEEIDAYINNIVKQLYADYNFKICHMFKDKYAKQTKNESKEDNTTLYKKKEIQMRAS